MTNNMHPTPGFLLSNIPGILGYLPTDSMVVFLFEQRNDNPLDNTLILGPVLRADIDAMCEPAGFIEAIDNADSDLVLAILIGNDDALGLAERFARLCKERFVPLGAVWQVDELYTGASYRKVSEHEPLPGWDDTAWERGVVSEIVASPSMASFVRRGELPALSREESYAYFDPGSAHECAKERAFLTRSAMINAESLLEAIEESDPEETESMVTAILDDFQDVIDHIISYNLSEDDIGRDDSLIDTAAVFFGHTWLRDPLLDCAVSEYAEAFYRLCVAVARATESEVRANALCCAAMAASFVGYSHRVTQALELAESASAHHRLTILMQQALHCGGLTLLYQACVEGAGLARAKLLSG